MKLECPVCFNLLSEKPDLKFKPEPDPDNSRPRVKKRRCGDEDEADSPSTDQLQEKAQLVVTKCGHLFHKCCLESWFATNLSCPTCRKPAPDGVEEFRNVFLPTPNDDDSQILFRNATGELEVTKIHLEALGEENESLKEENELLKKKIEELTNATRVKDRSSRKLQNDNDLMETCTNKLRDRHLRRMDQFTELKKQFDLLKTRASDLEVENTKLKRADSSQTRGRGGRGRGGRRGRGRTSSSSSNNSAILIDLTDD